MTDYTFVGGPWHGRVVNVDDRMGSVFMVEKDNPVRHRYLLDPVSKFALDQTHGNPVRVGGRAVLNDDAVLARQCADLTFEAIDRHGAEPLTIRFTEEYEPEFDITTIRLSAWKVAK